METKNEIAKDLGAWIKHHRIIAGLSQTDFWKKIIDKPYLKNPNGICELWVSRVETGDISELNKMLLTRMADVLTDSEIDSYLLQKEFHYLWSKFESTDNEKVDISHTHEKKQPIQMLSELLGAFHKENELGADGITIH